MSEEEHPMDEETPDGMEKRVRRVRKRRKGQKPKKEMKSFLDQGKEILEKMQRSEDHLGHVGVAEQVRRLQKDEEDDKPLDDVWGTKKRSTSWLWVSLVGIIVPIVAIVIAIDHFSSGREQDEIEVELLPDFLTYSDEDAALKDGALSWFNSDSVNLVTRARNILTLVNEAESAEEILPYVRDSPYRDRNPVRPRPNPSPMQVHNINLISWHPHEIEIRGKEEYKRGVLEIRGKRENGEKFSAFFVQEGHQFLLDWDATTRWSEMSLTDLRAYRPTSSKQIRCLMDKKPNYDREYRGITHSGYLLSVPQTGEFIFGFVPLDTDENKALDKELREVLHYGRFVMHLKHDEPVVLDVKAIGKDRFQIVGYRHRGWVNPESLVLNQPSLSQ